MDIDSNHPLDSIPPLTGSLIKKPFHLDIPAASNHRNNQKVDQISPPSSSRLQFHRSQADGIQSAALSIDVPLAEQARPNFDRRYTETSQDGEGESPGLDALAMVASGLA